MKTNAEIVQNHKLLVKEMGADGGMGFIAGLDYKHPNKQAAVIWSNGGGWDHVSVSWSNRCPTWEEMATVKRMFFRPDEVCVEYHPAESEYVNDFPYCLHIWRCQDQDFPTPPYWMVGPKDGQSVKDALREAERALYRQER